MKALEIGSKLFRYVSLSGVWEYEVIGIRTYKKEFQYEVKSLSCSHGWACELLIAQDDKGRLSYVSMLNNEDDDDQSYWHTNNETEFYFRTEKYLAQEDCYKYQLTFLDKELSANISKVEETKKRIKKYQDMIAVARGVSVNDLKSTT